MNDIAVIHTKKDEIILVDSDSLDDLKQFSWSLDNNGYPSRSFKIKGRSHGERMHRRIMGNPPGNQIDHRNNLRWINTKWNLRIATSRQNHANQRKQSGRSSSFKGVTWDKMANRWMAKIQFNGRSIYLGRYEQERDAAIAYNGAAMFHFGEFALLNEV